MQDRKLGRDMQIVSNKIKRKMDCATLCYDITHTQFYILLFIYHSKSEIFQKDIENAFNLRRSTVSKALSLLEKKELIKKESVARDARLKKIFVTKKGIDQIEIVSNTLKAIDDYLVSQIDTEDYKAFYRVLAKLSELTD